MNRVDRLHAILTVLQSKRVVRAEELATRFDISIRTVYRDLRALEEGGIPIGAEAGIGYFLTEGFQLPPIMFTHEEARALLLAGKFIEKKSDQSINTHFNTALTKIRAVLDLEKKDEMESLEQKILVDPFPDSKPQADDLQLSQIKKALVDNKVLAIEYLSLDSEIPTTRQVEAIGICFYYSSWHLIAYCRLRKDYRDFRLDRIKELKIISETFLRIHHPSIQEYINNQLSKVSLTTIVVKVDSSVTKHIGESKYSMGLISEEKKDTYTKMTFATFSIEYFLRWLLMLGDKVEIVSPAEAQTKINDLVKKLHEHYH